MPKYTKFFDMCSGGEQKTEFECIVIEGDEETATDIFTRKFGRDPRNVTCRCCGPDFSIGEYDSYDEATAYIIKHNMRFTCYSKE